MPADQNELDFDNNVYTVIKTYHSANLWNQVFLLEVPYYMESDPNKVDIVKKYMSKYLSPYIILTVMEVNGNIYFYLNKHKMYDKFN